MLWTQGHIQDTLGPSHPPANKSRLYQGSNGTLWLWPAVHVDRSERAVMVPDLKLSMSTSCCSKGDSGRDRPRAVRMETGEPPTRLPGAVMWPSLGAPARNTHGPCCQLKLCGQQQRVWRKLEWRFFAVMRAQGHPWLLHIHRAGFGT
jgi:hypothetical protein